MYYKKVETYNFIMPKEHSAYLKFRDELKESGITFLNEGSYRSQTITITTNGRFDTDGGDWKQE